MNLLPCCDVRSIDGVATATCVDRDSTFFLNKHIFLNKSQIKVYQKVIC